MVLQVCASFCKVSHHLFFRFVFFVFVFFCFILNFFLLLYFGTLREQNPYFLALYKKNNPDFFSTSRLFWHFARTLTQLLQFLNLQECELLRRFGASFIFFHFFFLFIKFLSSFFFFFYFSFTFFFFVFFFFLFFFFFFLFYFFLTS